MAKRKRYTVRRARPQDSTVLDMNGPLWEIEGPHGSWGRRRKRDAVAWARARARNDEPSQLVVFRVDGTIEYEHTYPRSSDPRPKPGSDRNRG